MKNPNWIEIDKDPNPGSYFVAMAQAFPILAKELDYWEEELVHCKMEVLARYAVAQIEKGNKEEVIRCFQFQEQHIDSFGLTLKNALYVSFCATLLLEPPKHLLQETRELMGENLKAYYDEYEEYYHKLFGAEDEENSQIM